MSAPIEETENILANDIRLREQNILRAHREQARRENEVLELFRLRFQNIIPLLEVRDITISAHYKTAAFEDGTYILFRRAGNFLKMDFKDQQLYRLEYTYPGDPGRTLYGKWSTDDFMVFLYSSQLFIENTNEYGQDTW